MANENEEQGSVPVVDRVKEWNRALECDVSAEASTSPLDTWIAKCPNKRKDEVEYLLSFNPELAPKVTDAGEFQKAVKIGNWIFLVVLAKTFPKQTEDGRIPLTVYLAIPNAEEIMKAYELDNLPNVKKEKNGAEYLEFGNLKQGYLDYCSGCDSDELLSEKTIKSIQDWMAQIAKSKKKSSKKGAFFFSYLFGRYTSTDDEGTFSIGSSRSKYSDSRSEVTDRQHKKCRKVVLSDRAYNQIFGETYSKIRTETGGLLLGHFEKSVWYVVEASDPGINAVFDIAYHEGDDVYENHVCSVMSRMYKYPLVFLGMWHRHPGSMDVFSGTDDQTNYKYAGSAGNGCISALVNIDPDFRLTFYYVEQGTRVNEVYYTKVDIEVGDDKFENLDILKLATSNEILGRMRRGGRNNG